VHVTYLTQAPTSDPKDSKFVCTPRALATSEALKIKELEAKIQVLETRILATSTTAPLTFTHFAKTSCGQAIIVGHDTADCRVGTKPTCSSNNDDCFNAQGAGVFNWNHGRCLMKTRAQAEAVCEKYRHGLTTANVRKGGQITFDACNAVGMTGGAYEPRICKTLPFGQNNNIWIANTLDGYVIPGYQDALNNRDPSGLSSAESATAAAAGHAALAALAAAGLAPIGPLDSAHYGHMYGSYGGGGHTYGVYGSSA